MTDYFDNTTILTESKTILYIFPKILIKNLHKHGIVINSS